MHKPESNKEFVFAEALLTWFDEFGRKNLPWQGKPTDTYHVWLSEIMLQQTQVTTVIDYFNRFIQALPTLQALAESDEEQVLALWAGLGYYARARNLHKTAQIILDQHQGKIPNEFKALLALPGIGESTAAAILSISFNKNHAILDGNVKRVLARYHQIDGHYSQSLVLKALWRLAKSHTPNARNAHYTQAIMDLGATLCTRASPSCGRCPMAMHCQAKLHNTQAQYPNPKPKKIKPTREIAMLVFTNEAGAVYLEKRPSKGIWGGLWSFPEVKDTAEAISATIAKFNQNAQKYKSLPVFKHSFTHYHLLIHPVVVHCPSGTRDFHQITTGVKLNIGLPAPVSKILTKMMA